MKKIILLSVIAIAIAGCNNRGSQMPPDSRVCAQNFTFDGSFNAGRTFKTTETIRGVSKATAIQRATNQIISEGMQIASTDRQGGIINARQMVSHARTTGGSVPYTVLLTPVQGGTKVDITFRISGGLTSPVTLVRNMMCSTMDAIKG